jgi:predicted TIM-barrel fold metal-dependent hydrolase
MKRIHRAHGPGPFVLAWCVAGAIALPVSGAESPGTGSLPRALTPWVDAHVHLEAADAVAAARSALQAMPMENARMLVLLPPPFTFEDPERYDLEALLPAIRGHESQLAAMGGGGSLNAMIQQAVQAGHLDEAVKSRFHDRALELLRLGAAGFGEFSIEHFKGATPYQWAPADHPLFELLADIAAEHRVPIVVHLEPALEDMPWPEGVRAPSEVPKLRGNVAAFERLLSYNPRATIIWAHAGWDNSGLRTPALCRQLLAKHPNLYMDVKVDPLRPGRNPVLSQGASGEVRPEWLELMREFPDRFVLGTDQHYPPPAVKTQRWEAIVGFLNQLPDPLRSKIAAENAAQLFARRIGR